MTNVQCSLLVSDYGILSRKNVRPKDNENSWEPVTTVTVKLETIIDVAFHRGHILFLVKWRGIGEPHLIFSNKLNKWYSQEVIKFYEKRTIKIYK